MFPLQIEVELVEHRCYMKKKETEDHQEEDDPWDEKASPPGLQSMTSHAVTHCRQRRK